MLRISTASAMNLWSSRRRAIDRARFRSLKRSIPNCSPICWSTENAVRCSEPALVNGACGRCDVCEVVTAAAKRAGLRLDVTPRTLRHSFATHLMDRGVDLAIIASLMGHRSPQETGVYLHVLPERPQAAVRKLAIGNQ